MISTLLPLLLAVPQTPPAPEPQPPAVQVANALAIELHRALAAAHPGQNLFFSPFSVSAALAMVAEGARGETLAGMRQAMGMPPDVPLADLHASFLHLQQRYRAGGGDASEAVHKRIADLRARLAAANQEAEALAGGRDWDKASAAAHRAAALATELNGLLTQVDRYELAVANALWVERSFPLVPAFVATIDRSYGTGAAQGLDFRGDVEGARRRINGWVGEQTRGRIQDLLPQGSIAADTPLLITNAIWFRGEWEQPFEARHTRDEDFLLAAGGRARVKLMRDRWRGSVRYAAFDGDGRWFATPREVSAEAMGKVPRTYPDDRGFTMVELPYKGGDLAMVVIAPRSPDGLPRVEELLGRGRLGDWLARLERRQVDTALPRFELRGAFELSAALQALGMQRAFVPPDGAGGGAQFGGISAAQDPRQQVCIGGVHHRAWIEVTEVGTEAAAATAVAMAPGAAMPRTVPFHPEFRADRPFLFAIRDVRSGAVLFLGRMVDPRGRG